MPKLAEVMHTLSRDALKPVAISSKTRTGPVVAGCDWSAAWGTPPAASSPPACEEDAAAAGVDTGGGALLLLVAGASAFGGIGCDTPGRLNEVTVPVEGSNETKIRHAPASPAPANVRGAGAVNWDEGAAGTSVPSLSTPSPPAVSDSRTDTTRLKFHTGTVLCMATPMTPECSLPASFESMKGFKESAMAATSASSPLAAPDPEGAGNADVGDDMIPLHTRRAPSVLIFAQAGCQPPGSLSGGFSARLLPVARQLAQEGRWLERRSGTVRRGYRRWAQRRVRCRPPEGREPKHG